MAVVENGNKAGSGIKFIKRNFLRVYCVISPTFEFMIWNNWN